MLANFVLENCNAPGAGTVTLAGAPAGRRTFLQAFSAGATVYYCLDDGTQSEAGYGTLTAGPPAALTRTPLWTSAGGTAPLNFTGATRVYCTLPAERALWADQAAVYQARGRRLANLASGVVASDAAQLGQVGWAQVGATVTLGAGSGGAIFTLPTLYNRFRVEFQDFAPTASAAVYFRASVDGGNTYEAGASEYTGVILQGLNSSASSSPASNSYGQITPPTPGAASGWFEVQADGNHEWLAQTMAPVAGGLALWQIGGVVSCSGVMTNLLIGSVGTTTAGARLRLLGSKF